MNKRLGLAVLGALALVARDAPRAEAKLLDLYASMKGGWVTGQGSNSLAANASDYFDLAQGPSMGFELGAEVLFIDFIVSGTRIFDQRSQDEVRVSGPGGGTLFQFLLGLDGDFALDSHPEPSTFLRLGVNGGVALGLHRDVRPPLDNDQVSDKGFVWNGVVALDYHLNKLFVVGLEASPGYHFFFPGGAAANQNVNEAENSHGTHFLGMAFVQFHLDPLTWESGSRPARPDPRPATYPEPDSQPPGPRRPPAP